MTGRIRVDITAGRHDITCKTNTIDTICLSGTGICGFTRLGANSNAGTVSSLGAGNFNFGSSSGISHTVKAVAMVQDSKIRYIRWQEDP